MYKAGVDLGGTNIAVGIINDQNEIIGRAKTKTALPRPAVEILTDMANCVKEAAANAGISLDELDGVGIGTPGSVDRENGIILYANNLGFDKVPAGEILFEQLKRPIYLENDANCAALGEAVAGAGKGRKSFVAITLGTGVGGGIVADGKLVTGCNGAGGELGHIVIKFDGEMCNCGRQGCWERYASATALISQTKAAMLEHPESAMWNLCGGKIDNVGGRTAFDAMRAGDPVGQQVVDHYTTYVAIGITDIINAMQPEMICFGGGICNEGDTLLNPIRDYVVKNRYSIYADTQTVLCRATLGNDAGIIGAALLA